MSYMSYKLVIAQTGGQTIKPKCMTYTFLSIGCWFFFLKGEQRCDAAERIMQFDFSSTLTSFQHVSMLAIFSDWKYRETLQVCWIVFTKQAHVSGVCAIAHTDRCGDWLIDWRHPHAVGCFQLASGCLHSEPSYLQTSGRIPQIPGVGLGWHLCSPQVIEMEFIFCVVSFHTVMSFFTILGA